MTSALEGGGGHGKADEGYGGCVNVTMTMNGGKGVKYPRILKTLYMEGPKIY